MMAPGEIIRRGRGLLREITLLRPGEGMLRGISPREARVLTAGSLLLLLLLGIFGVWLPERDRLRELSERVGERERSLAWMEAAAREVDALRGSSGGLAPASGKKLPLATVIEQSLQGGPLQPHLQRMLPDRESGLRLWFEEVPFDPLLLWLVTLKRDHGVVVESALFNRAGGAGRVRAELGLSGPGP
ncbi:MAG: type II secretion system protein M [Magnetococcales bacterium]|nr:type II secretion system protein M [Magnetococcales bacterium]MBF0156525.1 type II secretion system protein M [Magnetococcales bacterium]